MDRPPVAVPGAGAFLRSCPRARPVLRRPPAYPGGVVGGVGGDGRSRAGLPGGPAGGCAASGTGCGWPRCTRKDPGWCRSSAEGEHLDRLAGIRRAVLLLALLDSETCGGRPIPTTLSALPQPPYLRLTVKGVGDHSSALARLKPGTRVAIEGPYGVFTRHSQRRPRVLLIAGGIGVTAVRALLEDLPRGAKPVVVLRASQARGPGARRGDRRPGQAARRPVARADRQPRGRPTIDQYSLRRMVPDLTRAGHVRVRPGRIRDRDRRPGALARRTRTRPSTTRRTPCDRRRTGGQP